MKWVISVGANLTSNNHRRRRRRVNKDRYPSFCQIQRWTRAAVWEPEEAELSAWKLANSLTRFSTLRHRYCCPAIWKNWLRWSRWSEAGRRSGGWVSTRISPTRPNLQSPCCRWLGGGNCSVSWPTSLPVWLTLPHLPGWLLAAGAERWW